jgi:nucleoid DNA-binding protein
MKIRTGNTGCPPGTAERTETAEHLLPALAGAISAELLEKGSAGVCGLGVFSVEHFPAERRSEKDGTRYLPPGNRVVFRKRPADTGTFITMLVSRMQLDRQEAEKIGSFFTALFKDRCMQRSDVVFPGFGKIFCETDSVLRFEADKGFEGLLNSEYRDLTAIPLSSVDPANRGNRKYVFPALLVSALVLAIAGILSVAGSYKPQGASTAASRIEDAREEKPKPKQVSSIRNDRAGLEKVSRTGALLERGEYSVVLATFRKEQTAREELKKASVPGFPVFIWPVTGAGKKYFRLAAGRFSTAGAAAVWMDSTGIGRDGKAYIQQAKRSVVPYGEEGL